MTASHRLSEPEPTPGYAFGEEIKFPHPPQTTAILELINEEGGMEMAWECRDGHRWIPMHSSLDLTEAMDWPDLCRLVMRLRRFHLLVRQAGLSPRSWSEPS